MKPALLILLSVLLLSCQKQEKWQLHDISGHMPDLMFSLMDDQGHAVTARNYQGKIALVYFGFTGCSSQCPLVMTRLASVVKQLGPKADRIEVLFVSIDTIHDRPKTLRHYIAAFDSLHMTGLTGSDGDILDMAKRYRVAMEMKPDSNTVHGNSVYIFDQDGHARLILTPDDTDAAFVHDLLQLVS